MAWGATPFAFAAVILVGLDAEFGGLPSRERSAGAMPEKLIGELTSFESFDMRYFLGRVEVPSDWRN
jgi:hypothetical protein